MDTTHDVELPPGAIWGSMLGCSLWAFFLAGAFLVKGNGALALEVGLPSILAGLGVGALMVMLADLGLRAYGRTAQWRQLFFGALIFLMGLLLLLGTAWILPAIHEAGLSEAMGMLGMRAAPPWLSATAMLAGVVLLLRAMLTRRPTTGASSAG